MHSIPDDFMMDEEIVFEYDEFADFSAVEGRNFNFSLDGIFNNSLITVGAFIVLGIIFFGEETKSILVRLENCTVQWWMDVRGPQSAWTCKKKVSTAPSEASDKLLHTIIITITLLL